MPAIAFAYDKMPEEMWVDQCPPGIPGFFATQGELVMSLGATFGSVKCT